MQLCWAVPAHTADNTEGCNTQCCKVKLQACCSFRNTCTLVMHRMPHMLWHCYLAGSVSPDLRAGGLSVNLSIGWILKLLQNVGIVCFGCNLLCFSYSSAHRLQLPVGFRGFNTNVATDAMTGHFQHNIPITFKRSAFAVAVVVCETKL